MVAFEGGDIQKFWEGGEPYMGGLGILWGNLKTASKP